MAPFLVVVPTLCIAAPAKNRSKKCLYVRQAAMERVNSAFPASDFLITHIVLSAHIGGNLAKTKEIHFSNNLLEPLSQNFNFLVNNPVVISRSDLLVKTKYGLMNQRNDLCTMRSSYHDSVSGTS